MVLLNPIPLAQLSNVSRSLCKASLPSGRSTLQASLVSSANLLRVHSIPSSRSSIKILKRTGPSTDPWGMARSWPWMSERLCPVLSSKNRAARAHRKRDKSLISLSSTLSSLFPPFYPCRPEDHKSLPGVLLAALALWGRQLGFWWNVFNR